MGHLDKRIDLDRDATSRHGGRVKDGVSGNIHETADYQRNKKQDLPDGAAPDLVRQGDAAKVRAGRPR